MKSFRHFLLAIILVSFSYSMLSASQVIRWYRHYDMGTKAMKMGNWQQAADHFKAAIKVKNIDKKKIRAFGTMFIKYYPHRELGICYYHLGQMKLAKKELWLSLKQASSDKARQYLRLVGSGAPSTADKQDQDLKQKQPPPTQDFPQAPKEEKPSEITQVGERLRIAILSLENKGNLKGVDLVDKLITAFVKLDRFKVLERAQLEKILEQHQLNLSGFIDAATAVEIGKGIGVDAVIIGSVTWTRNSVSIDARIIETETATIISAQDAYCQGGDAQSINTMLEQLANKIKNDLPIVNGYVIAVADDKITLDLGRSKGMKKGMKCFIYREGAQIIHPITKKVLGISIEVLSEVQLREVYAEYSVAYMIKEREAEPRTGDMVITR